jgi:hypothetical protein
MTHLGGRSTEKDLFGEPGGYPVVMCAAYNGRPCPQMRDESSTKNHFWAAAFTPAAIASRCFNSG